MTCSYHAQYPRAGTGHPSCTCTDTESTPVLSLDEQRVLKAVAFLNAGGRTTNNSQVASESGLPRALVGTIVAKLMRYGYIRDAGSGAAYHWRLTTEGKTYQP